MGPYNYPLNETFATLIPALIMGNTMVFKPPQYGVLLFYPLLEAFRSAFPKGVINTVYGKGSVVVPRLLDSGKVNVLTLIGSSKVADHLKKLHPKAHRLRAILGLDAKNAAIVLPDADIELAVKECLLGSLSFNGQRCTALKMLIVHQSIVEPFLRRFTEELAKLKVGMPWEKGVSITPLPEPGKVDVHDRGWSRTPRPRARASSTRAAARRPARCSIRPWSIPVREGMKLYREEQFGPIVPVMPFEDLETALEYVITSEHGQQVSIFSADPDRIGALVDPLVNQVCRVNINCQCQRGPDVFPFTGRKDSAEGTLSVTDALRSFSIRSMIAAKQTEDSKRLLDAIVHGAQVQLHQHALHLLTAASSRSGRGPRALNADAPYRHAKIVATLGPASSSPEMIRALFEAGADVFRFNFSHGSHEEHQDALRHRAGDRAGDRPPDRRAGRPAGAEAAGRHAGRRPDRARRGRSDPLRPRPRRPAPATGCRCRIRRSSRPWRPAFIC